MLIVIVGGAGDPTRMRRGVTSQSRALRSTMAGKAWMTQRFKSVNHAIGQTSMIALSQRFKSVNYAIKPEHDRVETNAQKREIMRSSQKAMLATHTRPRPVNPACMEPTKV